MNLVLDHHRGFCLAFHQADVYLFTLSSLASVAIVLPLFRSLLFCCLPAGCYVFTSPGGPIVDRVAHGRRLFRGRSGGA